MSWFRIGAWIFLTALVLVILGGYVSQWYRAQVSERMDSMLGREYDPDEPPEVVLVNPAASIPETQTLLDTGYISDE